MPTTATKPKRSTKSANDLPRRNGHDPPFDDNLLKKIVSQSPLMDEVYQFVRQVAPVDSTVLVTGESGTGKELIAEAIHAASERSAGPFVTINMAAVPEALVESELFGHVKGSFTGAAADRVGRFEAAKGGTIFVDEIGDLHPPSQAKLLRVLENRIVTPVGGNDDREVDVRVVAATHRPLEKMVADDDFREDLYYRLNVVRISLPPLRKRQGDIPMLVRHFVDYFCETYNRMPLDVDEELMAFLDSHPWPGNVRELRNCVESMVVLTNADMLTSDDVPPVVRKNARNPLPRFEVPDNISLAEIEETIITETLERCDGNRTRAAQKLDISVRTLQRRLARASKEVA
ncbi:MAG: sigma-54 dependent transcriptional regulator [Pirellulaceae bacterium]|nr:sigma-54-dependent Fis family transcriptional regulator [Planctomycetales bacterium]